MPCLLPCGLSDTINRVKNRRGSNRMKNDVSRCTELLLDAWMDAFAAPAFLCGMDDSAQSMRDEGIREFLGNTLMYEMMPYLPFEKQTIEKSIIAVCAILENTVTPVKLMDRIWNLPERFEKELLPLMDQYAMEHFEMPHGLAFSLACLMMLFAGVRRDDKNVYSIARGEETYALHGDEEMLEAMSHLACDMTADSLVYAVLSDRVVWTKDLRDVPGLEDSVMRAVTDIQMLGVRQAMQEAAKRCKAGKKE